MRWLAASFGLACVAATLVCATVSARPRNYYVRVAEGLTSPSLTEAMSIAPRMFGAAELVSACQETQRTARLEAPARTLDLRVGDRLTLSTLRVVAVSAANVAMRQVPVVIEAEERNPPIVELRSDGPDLEAGRLLMVGRGRFRIRVRTMCTSSSAETIITAVVAA
jgi:hypothetical protein